MNIDDIVKNKLCSGCGVCVSEDSSKEAKMVWNEEGFLVPALGQNSTQEKMIKVCPFAEHQKNEDELADVFLRSPTIKHNEKIGNYLGLYAGYSQQFRRTSSSGGLATYLFKTLLEQNIVHYLFVVKELNGTYGYQFFSDVEQITEISKTRYTPVTLEKLFLEINNLEGKVGVVGVACFVKAIRLKQLQDSNLKEKIPFIVGIICGGLKSRYYTDYLVQESGCYTQYHSAQYRVKNEASYALDYNFSCIAQPDNKIHMVEMKTLGDMWGTGLFKSNACDFCDDVLTELADVSLGDAWISPYDKSGLGNSIIITRSPIADSLIQSGLNNSDLVLDSVDENAIIASQQGSFNHRQNGLLYRLSVFHNRGKETPHKRQRVLKRQNILVNSVQKHRLITRQKSLEVWKETLDAFRFREKMHPYLQSLRNHTQMSHKYARLVNILNKVISR